MSMKLPNSLRAMSAKEEAPNGNKKELGRNRRICVKAS